MEYLASKREDSGDEVAGAASQTRPDTIHSQGMLRENERGNMASNSEIEQGTGASFKF